MIYSYLDSVNIFVFENQFFSRGQYTVLYTQYFYFTFVILFSLFRDLI